MGMSKRACQGGRTNSGESVSLGDSPLMTPLSTFSDRLPGWHPGHPHPTNDSDLRCCSASVNP